MALSYSTIFQKIGKLIKNSNSVEALASTTLPASLNEITVIYGTSSSTYGTSQGPINGLDAKYLQYQNNVVAWRQGLQPFVEATLTDVDTVISQLTGLTGTDKATVLAAIIRDMNDTSNTVKGNTVTLGAVTAGTGNVGNGTALVDKTLDGYNAPLRSGAAHIKYNALASELAVPTETMQLVCTSDSYSGGGSEGSEQWSWAGGTAYPLFDFHPEGSGTGPGLTTAHSETIISNLNFEDFSTANTPDSWTIVTGVAGTTIFEETTAADVYRGDSALEFRGNGATASINITQSISASLMRPRRRYLFTIRMKLDGGPGGGNTVIKFTGTGYTAAASEKIEVATSTIPASYTLYSFYWNTPSTIPDDLKISIDVNGTLASAVSVWFDSGSFSPVVYHGGVNAVIVSGSTSWVLGDRMTFTVTNTTTGLFQNYVRRAMAVQLPSSLLGTETITDSWAS